MLKELKKEIDDAFGEVKLKDIGLGIVAGFIYFGFVYLLIKLILR